MWRFLAEVLAVTAKDLKAEFRTRVALNSLALFALTTLAAVAYAIGPFRLASEDRPFVLSALLWVVIFFASMAGLDRAFVKEEESHTAPLLRLAAEAHVVWLGKLLYNLGLLIFLMAILVPIYCAIMNMPLVLTRSFVLLLVVGAYALAVVTTMVAAIIARAMSRGALFSVLALPLLLPTLIFLIQGTTAVAVGDVENFRSAVRAVVAFAGIMTVFSALLFPEVWND